jgi:ribosomal protein S18 acetylase RimI-like enzyme
VIWHCNKLNLPREVFFFSAVIAPAVILGMVDDEEYSVAVGNDIPALERLVNSAYRGDSSKKGWTTEADLLDGIRTDTAALESMIQQPGSVILKYEQGDQLLGCVFLQRQGSDMYLGMLTVDPESQAKGIGKKMINRSEAYAKEQGCSAIVMTVISSRTELIDWYKRRGYYLTGEKKPFPSDPRFGIPKKPLEFIVMKKEL